MSKGIIINIDPRSNRGEIREILDGGIASFDIPSGYANPREAPTFSVSDPVDFT